MTNRKRHLNPLLAWFVLAVAAFLIAGGIGLLVGIPEAGPIAAALLAACAVLHGVLSALLSRRSRRFARRHPGVTTGMLVALILAGTYAWFFWTPLGDLVLAREYQGIIMRVGSVSGEQWSNAWDVARSDIRRFERDLSAHVGSNTNTFGDFIPAHLPEYRRRYHGFEEEGDRFIACTLEHPEFTSRHTWLRHVYWTAGGGYLIWYITYDVEAGSFTNFFTNAPM